MSAGKICTRSVVVISPDDSVRAAARRMAEYDVGALVVQEENRTVGILSDRDIAIRCVGKDLDPDVDTVANIMTAPVRSIQEATPIEAALSAMAASGVRRLPVVDAEDRLIGILALDDVLELLGEEAETIGRLMARYGPDIPAR